VFVSGNGLANNFYLFSTNLRLCSFFPAPYIKPCARSEPNFNECALEHAKDAFPQMIKGKVSFCSSSLSRPSRLIAKSLFIWENIKADIASQVPDFEGSKKVRVLDHAVTVIGRFLFLQKEKVVYEEYIYIHLFIYLYTYIHTKVTELKKFIGKELYIKVKI